MDDGLLVDRYTEAVDGGLRPIQSPSSIRSRRAELVTLGQVRDTGRTTVTPWNRDATVWDLVGRTPPATREEHGNGSVRPLDEDPEPEL